MQQEINLSNLFSTYSSSLVIAKDADEPRPIYCVTCQDIAIGNAFMEDYNYFELEECKLALKPLSAITDEDCLTIASILEFYDASDSYNIWCVKQVILENPTMFIRYDEAFIRYNEARDTLRLLGYDCGYMHILSLIEDGCYAVDITKLQTP